MILVNHGAATMLQFREIAAWQHEVMFCIVYLQFVEFYIPQEIAVAQMQTAMGRRGTWQQHQRKLVIKSQQPGKKDQVPVITMRPGSWDRPWSGHLSQGPREHWTTLASHLVNEWYWCPTSIITDCHHHWKYSSKLIPVGWSRYICMRYYTME